ncbi:MAG: nucleoside hydrolase [Ruminococcaceae bacterium]|nr:nucleoside hydrolase [Oscillospiraceae bacterium]
MDISTYFKHLEKPTGRVEAILDTDTYNEIDDQFALAYLLRSQDKVDLKAIYAAPFLNIKSTSAADGMEKSYDEILKLLDFMKIEYTDVYKGSAAFLSNEKEPVLSGAAADLVKRVKNRSADDPLYIVAIGAITNIASALLIDPTIKDKIIVIWLGGHAFHWHNNREFNLFQDIAAARVVFASGCPLILFPCMGVVDHLATTGPELDFWLKGKNELCDYLVKITEEEAKLYYTSEAWSRSIWDVAAAAWLAGPDNGIYSRLEHRPVPQYDDRYSIDKEAPLIRYVYGISRDIIFEDLFNKLAE